MERLRSDIAITATLLVTDGTLGGAIVAGPLGAVIGLIGSAILGSRVRDGSNDMKRWLDVDSSKGGVRITETEEFPIASLQSISQSPIKKL